jgi:putative transcriptional regulator
VRSLAQAFAGVVLALLSGLGQAGVEDDGEAIMLVASPQMPDSRFARTVLVVAFPQDTGPMGVVLNRPAGMTIGDLFGPDRPELAQHEDPILLGGPVEPDGMLFVFPWPEHPVKALPLAEGVYLSGDGKLFESLVSPKDRPARRRFFAGHSAWAEGQLDAEIAEGGWLVLPVDPEALFDPDIAGLYDRLLQRAQGRSAKIEPTAPAPSAKHAARVPASGAPLWSARAVRAAVP